MVPFLTSKPRKQPAEKVCPQGSKRGFMASSDELYRSKQMGQSDTLTASSSDRIPAADDDLPTAVEDMPTTHYNRLRAA